RRRPRCGRGRVFNRKRSCSKFARVRARPTDRGHSSSRTASDDAALERLMLFRQFKSIVQAFYALFADSGFAMAGAVAYSFVLSFFPFCIFLGALAGYFGGEPLAKEAIARLFALVP